MKIRGKQKFDVPRKTVRLSRTVSGPNGEDLYEELMIRVRALPVGTERRMFELFPDPEKPQDFAKDPRGMIMRDPDTKKPMLREVETPEYVEAVTKNTRGRLAYMLFHGIDDPEVQFEGSEGADRSAAFYEKIYDQLVEFGFTMGDLGRLMTEISGLMNMANDIEVAKGN